MRPDIHTLTGAYALNALPDDERELFEEHLDVCDACAQEVAELLATAAKLGSSLYEPPSPDMRQKVLAAIDQVRQEPPTKPSAEVVDLAQVRRVPRWVLGVLAPAAAVLAIAGVALALTVADLRDRVDDLQATSDRVTSVIAAPDAQDFLVALDGTSVRLVMSPSRGEAVLVVDGMAPAPTDAVYEAWLIHDDVRVPAGLFDVDDRGQATHVVTGDMSTVTAVGVTVEPPGGSPQPTSDPVMLIEVAS
jgi:anti-sigma-K factor RskA